ncbi:MAG: hypothetical protein HYU64_21195 [Armatimonadetes bacterium]|nr:hypothetical protein [Armatimonadota bacterium]
MQKAASLSGDARRQKLQELAKDRAQVDMDLEKKEGELRKAEALATLNTQGATYERPKTLSPGKVAYSKEATAEDYLAGRVEGQDYKYKKRGPLCKRCHTLRKGKRKIEVHPETTPDGIKLPEQQQLRPEDIGE